MMNLENYVENHGKKNIIIFVLIDLKREIKEDIVFVMKAKKNIYRSNTSDKGFLKKKQPHSHSFKCCIQLKTEKI